VRAPLHIPPSVSLLKLLETFQSASVHLAVVTDEYGGIRGLVRPADILKAIAGELPELGSREHADATRREDGSWLLDGHLSIHEAERVFERNDLAHWDNYHTVAGFVLWHLGRLPVAGERMSWRDLHFEVVDMDGARIDKVLIARRAKSEAPESKASQ
jgi:putative hemolysin